ncbi:IS1595 family transposase [Mycoplasmatota bacterium]|nr:IS1595 family transposase [Mycoplasmatota bacterium]QVK18234.1 IS1595 family transposase [Mycoplasmatota bacterium]QVK19280.1 IS1595 family transposase [Mycoplasmatota bacterium]
MINKIDLINELNKLSIKNYEDVFSFIMSFNNPIESKSDICLNCPHCGSVEFVKNGKTNKGIQRYICRECNKSFCDTSNTLLYRSRCTEDIWLKFIDCEISGLSLKETAYYNNLSITTCFYMRHKLYKAIRNLKMKETLSSKVELDCIYTKINLKGTKPSNMPRHSKKRGNTSAYSGISHHKVCIVAAIDENDNMLLEIAGVGSESMEKYTKYTDKFMDTTLIISDSKPCIQQFANNLGVKNDKVPVIANKKRYTTNLGNSLGDINQLATGITKIIKNSHGVSIRHLQDYLSFYLYKKQLHYRTNRKDHANIMYNLLKYNHHLSNKDTLNFDYPISLKDAYYEYRYGIFA